MKPSDEAIACAAAYWRRTLGGLFLFDNGEKGRSSEFAAGMAMTLRASMIDMVTEAVLVAFEAGIVKRLRELRDRDAPPIMFTLATDYSPGHILFGALVDAGLPTRVAGSSAILPWKTVLWVRESRVFVREGYGAPTKYLLGEESP